jgi:hypothetical protein
MFTQKRNLDIRDDIESIGFCLRFKLKQSLGSDIPTAGAYLFKEIMNTKRSVKDTMFS